MKRIQHLLSIALSAMIFVLLFTFIPIDSGRAYAASRPARPAISSLTGSGTSITVKSKKYSGIKGFKVQYSTSKTFRGKKSGSVKGVKLNRTFTSLKRGKTYYVRIRTYKLSGGKKKYSKWSKVKKITIPKYKAYTSSLWTTIYTKKSTSSKSAKLWYHTPVNVIKTTKKGNGIWFQFEYRGKTYFIWAPKGQTKLVKSIHSQDYTSTSNSAYQNAVVREAVSICRNWDTKYDYSHSAVLGAKTNGKYAFDCSGFASYVLTKVLKKDCPAYYISRGDVELYNTGNVLNGGLRGEFNQPGDLLFFKEDRSSSHAIDHVGIYLGNREFIQSTKMYQRYPGDTTGGKPTGGVCIAPLDDKYVSEFVAAKRFIPKSFTSADITASVSDYTGLYAGEKCNGSSGHEKITSMSPGDTVKILYTLNRGDGAKVAYVQYSGRTGYVINTKLKY